jgi:hypothetical protein
MRHPIFRISSALAIGALAFLRTAHAEPKIDLKGGASFALGRIVKSSDTTARHYSGNPIENVSARLLLNANLSDNLTVSAGLGVTERNVLPGNSNESGGRSLFTFYPYIVNAEGRYSFWRTDEKSFTIEAGYFPYSYNPDVKDLGLYLLRGPVYPGVVVSGYDSKYTQPVSNTMGVRLQHVTGGFEQNLIVGSEVENYPYFDFSPAYLASMRFGNALRIGAGVNFYHVLPITRKMTYPDSFASDQTDDNANFNGDPNTRTYIYVDTVAHDTSFLSFAGTKVMANFSLDPKAFFDNSIFGPEDLKIYGEAAIIGLDRSKAYTAVYGDLLHRMPLMLGFNFPAFNFLDHISLEVEWYGSKVKDDLSRLQATTGSLESPLPVANISSLNLTRDNWKWALQASKTMGQIQFLVQVANDHSRQGGTPRYPGSEWGTYFVAPNDKYWLAKVGFFF